MKTIHKEDKEEEYETLAEDIAGSLYIRYDGVYNPFKGRFDLLLGVTPDNLVDYNDNIIGRISTTLSHIIIFLT